MLEFPISVNERIWETASPSILSGPSLARPMSIHLRHLTSGNASWRSSGAAPGTCGRCWVRRHFAAKMVAPFGHSPGPPLKSPDGTRVPSEKKTGGTREEDDLTVAVVLATIIFHVLRKFVDCRLFWKQTREHRYIRAFVSVIFLLREKESMRC